jgi:hypothetical protein
MVGRQALHVNGGAKVLVAMAMKLVTGLLFPGAYQKNQKKDWNTSGFKDISHM